MTALAVLNAPTTRTVEMDPDLFQAALRAFNVEGSTVQKSYVGFVEDGVCLGISHEVGGRAEILVLHVDETLIDSLFGPVFAEEHGGWFEMKPYTINDILIHFIEVSLQLRRMSEHPVKVRVIRIT